MMTLQEREAAFIQAMHEAEVKFGCTAIAVTEARKYGEAVMVEAKVLVVPMANWNPPPEPAPRSSEVLTVIREQGNDE